MILISPLKVEGTAIDYDYDYGMHGDSFEMTRDTYCMALNIYHESRSENLAGKFAVADVVMNRVNDRRYPDKICGVIYDAELKPSWKDPTIYVPVRNRCQFSWYCDGKSDEPADNRRMERISLSCTPSNIRRSYEWINRRCNSLPYSLH